MDSPRKTARKSKEGSAPTEVATQARSAATREKLLAAATAGFAREGYDGYSSRMISNDSTIHHGLIAYHFGGKLGLWKACLLRIIMDWREHVAARQAEVADEVARLRMMFEEWIRFNARNPEFQAMMIDAAGSSDGRFAWVMQTLGRGENDRWRALVAKAQAQGKFVEGDPDLLLNLYYGAATRMYVMAAEVESNTGRTPFAPEHIDAHVAAVLGLFFRG